MGKTKVVAKGVAGVMEPALEKLFVKEADDVAGKAAREAAEEAAEKAGKKATEKAGKEVTEEAGEGAARKTAKSLDDGITGKAPGAKSVTDDPIDVATGEVLMAQTDVALPGVLALVIERMHLSSYRQGGRFGISWASTLDQRLELSADGVRYAAPDGTIRTYPHAFSPGTAMPPTTGPFRPLTWLGNDGYLIEDPQTGQRLHFPADSTVHGSRLPITAISDRNGNHITFDYDETGTLTGLRHSGGYHITVDTNGPPARQRVTALRLTPERGEDIVLVRYGYDTDGNLTEVTNSSGLPLRYSYDDMGRMTGWKDRNGYEYHYDYDEYGRAIRGYGSDGYLNTSLAYDPDGHRTVVTDSLGHQATYHLNDRQQVIAETNPLGHTVRSEWDERDQLISRTDPLDRTTRYEYDGRGNVAMVTRPDGARARTAYNALGLPVELIEAGGAVWRQEYDDRGNLTAVTDPMGAVTRYSYGERGRLIAMTDAMGGVTRIESDTAGLPTVVTDPLGNISRYARDVFGRLASATSPTGRINRFWWTVEGRPAWRRRADDTTERWTHDAEGNLIEHIDTAGRSTKAEFAHFDMPVAEVQPDGARVEFTYDTEMRLISATNSQQLVWKYDYDAAGNMISETDFNGRVVKYIYDAAGQLTRRINGAGEVSTYRYDVLGNVIEKRSGEAVATFAYDRSGRLVRATNASVELRLERNARGHVVAENCNGRVLASVYDALGRRIRRQTPSGSEAVWRYDSANRPVALHAAGETLQFAYDAEGQEIQRRIGGDAVLDQSWDTRHRLSAQTLWGVRGSASGGQWAEASQARLLQHRTYSYDPAGNVTGIGDRLVGPRRFDLDPAGRVAVVQGHGWNERYSYDHAGNITRAEWSKSLHDADADAAGVREYSGTLITRAGSVRYEYDAQGRVVLRQHKRLSGRPLTWRYMWDADDQLTAVVTPDGQEWRYQYDPLGRRIAKQRMTPDGSHVIERVDFTWDEFVLAEQSHTVWRHAGPKAHTTAWIYEPGGHRPVAQVERGPVRDAPQQWIDEQFYAIVTDLVGGPAELVDAGGNIGWYSSTSLWGAEQPKQVNRAYCPLRFPGQYFDHETGLNYNYHRYYNPADGRYQSSDPVGLLAGVNPYGYVHNPTGWFDFLGLGGCTITVYRKQTDHPLSKRMSVDSHGNVTLKGKGKLYVNMSDDIAHSRNFRPGDGEIVAFDMPASYRDHIRDIAVPQRNPGDFTPGEWKEMLKICPEISDPTKSTDLYGIPSSMFGEFRDAIIPGSGRVLGG
jgi:RHS repeat-associated protein